MTEGEKTEGRKEGKRNELKTEGRKEGKRNELKTEGEKIEDFDARICEEAREKLKIKRKKEKSTELAEKALADQIKNCTACRLADTRTHALPGEGNLLGRLMLIAQAPGENEDREGRMFIGPSGKVLDDLLRKAGVERDEVYMTNLVKCMLPKNRRPKQDEIDSCSRFLEQEIKLVNPEVVVPLGYFATKFVFTLFGCQIAARTDFPGLVGKLIWTGERTIYPLPHPAALLHEESIKDPMEKNYRKLGILRSVCKWYPTCPMRRFHEVGTVEEHWIRLNCRGDWESCVRFQMEENGEPHPDWMLPDGTTDERLKSSLAKGF